MTFKITAWNSDGTDVVEIDGPVSSDRVMEAEPESREIWCPDCFKKMTVGHLNWHSLTCRNCKEEVEKPDWLMPLGL